MPNLSVLNGETFKREVSVEIDFNGKVPVHRHNFCVPLTMMVKSNITTALVAKYILCYLCPKKVIGLFDNVLYN